jgi:hypothetical protein
MKKEVEKAMRLAEDPRTSKVLNEDLERLESLLALAEPKSEQWGLVVQALTAAYRQGLVMIAVAAKAMGYPKNPWEWDDSAPIDALAELLPGVLGSEWHQRMLGQILMAPAKPHPWYSLPTVA